MRPGRLGRAMEWIGYLGPAGTCAPLWVVLGVATDVCGDPALCPSRYPGLPPPLLLPSSSWSSSGSFYRTEREGNQTEEDVSPHGVVLHRLSVPFLFIHVRLALSSQLRARRTIRDSVWMIISLPYDVLCNKNKCAKSCFPACNLWFSFRYMYIKLR